MESSLVFFVLIVTPLTAFLAGLVVLIRAGQGFSPAFSGALRCWALTVLVSFGSGFTFAAAFGDGPAVTVLTAIAVAVGFVLWTRRELRRQPQRDDEKPETRHTTFGRVLRNTVLVVLLGSPVGCVYLEHRASTNAEAFRASVDLGTPISDVAKATEGVGYHLRLVNEDRVSVGFVGIPPFSRYMCTVTAEQGVVVSAEAWHLD